MEIVGEPDDIDPTEPDILHKEGAWGSGEDFTGNNWAMYNEYEVERLSDNDCYNAEPIGDATGISFSTRDATFDSADHCMSSPNIWYCYTATCAGDVTVSLLGSSYDTMLAIYNECVCHPTSKALMACNDDFGGTGQSRVTFPAVAGNPYLIEIGGYSSETGEGVLSISCEEVGSCPLCEDVNGDGVINTQDLVDFTAAWLENCPE